MGDKTLVVGASGFLGGSIARALLSQGRAVRAGVRTEAFARWAQALGAEPVILDLLEPQTLRTAMAGCDLVYHAGGLNTMCPRDPGRLFLVNVQGSTNLVEAAAHEGVRRVVYTSSAATLGEAKGEVGTRDSRHRGSFLSQYERSKFLAEQAVLRLARERDLELVCVNPSSVQGPGRTGGTARWLIRYADGRLRYLIDTRVSLVAVSDCTTAHLLAADRGLPGQRYVISGGTLPIQELVELVAQVTGRRHTIRLLPGVVAMAGAQLVEAAFAIRGTRPPVCREMVRTLRHGHAYDGQTAAQELGFEYTPMLELVRSTLLWFVRQGLIRDSSWTGAQGGP